MGKHEVVYTIHFWRTEELLPLLTEIQAVWFQIQKPWNDVADVFWVLNSRNIDIFLSGQNPEQPGLSSDFNPLWAGVWTGDLLKALPSAFVSAFTTWRKITPWGIPLTFFSGWAVQLEVRLPQSEIFTKLSCYFGNWSGISAVRQKVWRGLLGCVQMGAGVMDFTTVTCLCLLRLDALACKSQVKQRLQVKQIGNVFFQFHTYSVVRSS